MKAARFPNPLVPFAYAVLGMSSGSISLPVYIPSPSIHKEVIEIYIDCFGDKDSIELVRSILLVKETKASRERIEKKVVKIVEILSKQRKRADILKPAEWAEFYSQTSGLAKSQWLIKKAMPWNKKTSIKSLTPTFGQLLKAANEVKAAAIGSSDMPICIIAPENRPLFGDRIKKIYKDKIDSKFNDWISGTTRPLLCVWVAGFKPQGDDSRPDRGLVPLARMIFGLEDVDLVTVVYGPAKPSMWAALASDMWKLASSNGLWEAIINLSNAVIVDSSTGTALKNYGFLMDKKKIVFEKKLLPAASNSPHFGEHDVDSVLHLLFSNSIRLGVYESMCNPPGGDWSGVNILNFSTDQEFRWTSLPRVSGLESKRPDHLIQLKAGNVLLSAESKDVQERLENDIGPRLMAYAKTLLNKAPTVHRKRGDDGWKPYDDIKLGDFNYLSGGAFVFKKVDDLKIALKRGGVDVVFGVEFQPDAKLTILHIMTSNKGAVLLPIVKTLAEKLNGLVKITIHES